MDPYENRADAFAEGSEPSSLEQRASLFNSQVPTSFQARSPLHQLIRSPNGLSARDADRRLLGPGTPLLPTSNGSSAQSYEQKRPFMSTTLNA